MRYDLAVGTSYLYDVMSDQHVVKNSAVRLQTNLAIDVVGLDARDNFKIKLRVRGDTVKDEEGKNVYKPAGTMDFSGHRLFSDAGRYNAALDALGRVILGQSVIDGPEAQLEIQTQFERTTDISVAEAEGTNSSTMLNFTVPSLPFHTSLEIGKQYFDTTFVPSRVIDLPISYGPEAKTKRNEFVDSIFRAFVLDSVVTSGASSVGYMTIHSNRHNRFGARFTSSSKIKRNLRTGMVINLSETCYRVTSMGPELEYSASATLTGTSQLAPTKRKQ
ncbi:MAG: hypothetical protein HQ472_02600 [Ignavibacteria bacterium]|nr:hypothetical protein [Ignavibacteria bacterium]